MATNKSKKTSAKKSSNKSAKTTVKTAKVVKAPKAPVAEAITSEVDEAHPMKGFFAKKCDASENILTIFKSPRIYGALIGEVIGTMLLAIILIALGSGYIQYTAVAVGVIAILAAIHGLSGAHLNPIVTAGMMATRRISAIRGVLYMLAQVLGAYLGLLVAGAFIGIAGADSGLEAPVMSEIAEGQYWQVTLTEMALSAVFAFFVARALKYQKSVLTFAVMVGSALSCIIFASIILAYTYFGVQSLFAVNPAMALMFQILPTEADGFWPLMGEAVKMLFTYVILPMVGGVIGFYVADAASRLSGEKCCCKAGKCEK